MSYESCRKSNTWTLTSGCTPSLSRLEDESNMVISSGNILSVQEALGLWGISHDRGPNRWQESPPFCVRVA